MFDDVRLPPLFRLIAVGGAGDVRAAAGQAARGGADPGTVYCAEDPAEFRCAVVLAPEQKLSEAAQVLYVGVLGVVDALGATAPPGLDVTVVWPNRIDANLGGVGEVTLDWPDGLGDADVPDWMVLACRVAVGSAESDYVPRAFPATTLWEEGAGEVRTPDLLDSFPRHFLAWLHRWQEEGFGPVRAMWLRRAPELGNALAARDTVGLTAGERIEGLDGDGALSVAGPEGARRISLLDALRGAES